MNAPSFYRGSDSLTGRLLMAGNLVATSEVTPRSNHLSGHTNTPDLFPSLLHSGTVLSHRTYMQQFMQSTIAVDQKLDHTKPISRTCAGDTYTLPVRS